jgi:hypothetical protein
MNVTNFSELTSRITISPSALPTLLWEYYLEYLWFYQPSSWVARTAYAFRVLAFLLILPITLLTLLDIASYVVARTLGVVDDVKASTSDAKITPTIIVEDTSTANTSLSSSSTLVELSHHAKDQVAGVKSDTLESSQPDTYFTSEDNNLKLSGVGVFSPAASQPPSPTMTRRQLPNQDPWNLPDGKLASRIEEIGTLRKRTAGGVIEK